MRKVVLRNFAKFTGKHLCQSFFFNHVAGLGPQRQLLTNYLISRESNSNINENKIRNLK